MTRTVTSLILTALILWAAVPAEAYIYQYSSSSVQIRWTTATINIALSNSLAAPPPNIKAGSDVLGAARRAMRRWSDATNIQFVESSTGLEAVNPPGTAGDGVSLITVAANPTNIAFTSGRVGRTRVSFDAATGRIFESDLALNPAMQFSTDGSHGTYDLESTFVHELGHLLGLDHSGVVGSSMQPRQGQSFQLQGISAPAFTMRTLSDDDLAGIRSIYGQRVAAPTGSIAGQVNYGAGAHVWAENVYTGKVAGSSITKSDGSYRIDQLPPSDYRVVVEYLDEPVFASEISASIPYSGIGRQSPFRASENQVNVGAGNTTILNPLVNATPASFNPRILGVNGVLQGTAIQLAAGRVYRFSVGGSFLDNIPLTTSGFSLNTPFITINPASFARENPASYGLTEPNFGIVSFDITVSDAAKYGDYSLRLRADSGEVEYLSGAVAIDPYTDYVEVNPLNNNGFFVRQQYLDFLYREPEASGFNAWVGVLNRCVGNTPDCDRIVVSQSFFQSQEFQLKGFFIYRFYAVSFGRRPQYAEIIPDMQFVTGNTTDEVNAKRNAYTEAFTQRQDFKQLYGGLAPDAYVDSLSRRAGVTMSNRDQLVRDMASGAMTRGQALRAIVESQPVFDKEYNSAFVAMQYFGYLKRNPEQSGFEAWLNYLNTHPGDFRTMVSGFVNSGEYRSRFAQ